MANFEVEVDDLAVRNLLAAMPNRVDVALRAAMTDVTTVLQRDLKRYPPPPSHEEGFVPKPVNFTTKAGVQVSFVAGGYKRTGTLGRHWTREISGVGMEITGVIGTNVTYAPYVQDEDRQAKVHQGRWPTIQSVGRDRQALIENTFRERLRYMLR